MPLRRTARARGEPAVAAAGRAGCLLAEKEMEGWDEQRGDGTAGADGTAVRADAAAAPASGDVPRRVRAGRGDPTVGGAAGAGRNVRRRGGEASDSSRLTGQARSGKLPRWGPDGPGRLKFLSPRCLKFL